MFPNQEISTIPETIEYDILSNQLDNENNDEGEFDDETRGEFVDESEDEFDDETEGESWDKRPKCPFDSTQHESSVCSN